jgi:uncharacterized membrane protein YgcG
LISLLALFGALLLLPATALAASPALSGQITDPGGRISSADVARVSAAIEALRSSSGINLRVYLGDSMNGADPAAYAKTMATDNGLGTHDALLTVTFSDREYAIWVGDGLTGVISTDKIQSILTGSVAQSLRNGDTAGAVIAAANGLGTVSSIPNAPTANSGTGTTTPPAPSKPFDWGGLLMLMLVIVGVVIFCVLAVILLLFAVAFSRAHAAAGSLGSQVADLRKQASAALVAADAAVQSGSQDADFAEAEFGSAIAAPAKTLVANMATKSKQAFALAATAEDPNTADPAPDDADLTGSVFDRFFAARVDRRAVAQKRIYAQVLEDAKAINDALAAQAASLAALRAAESDLPGKVPALREALAAARSAIAAAKPRASALAARSASAYESVKTNIDGADQLAASAEQDIATAITGAAPGASGPDRGAGTIAADRASGRLDKIKVLLAALDTMSGSVDTAAADLPARLRTAASEIERASHADTGNDVAGEEKAVTGAQNYLDTAKRLSASDPYAADQAAISALAAADAVLGQIRDAQAARARREAAAQEAYRSAQRSLDEAESYVNSHHSTVRSATRHQLEDARARFSHFDDHTNIATLVASMAVLTAVQHDASGAYSAARQDVSDHEDTYSSYSSGSSYSSHDTSFGGGLSSGGGFGGGGGISFGGSFGGGGGISSGGHW